MDEVFEWYRKRTAIEVDSRITLRKSEIDDPNSGYGLYTDTKSLKEIKGDDKDFDILLRIPRNVTFNIHTILSLVQDEFQYSSKTRYKETTDKVKEIFQLFMEKSDMEDTLSETIIIVYYFIMFCYIKDEYELPEVLLKYLNEVLLVTEVYNPITRPYYYLKYYYQYPTIVANEIVVDRFTRFFSSEFFNKSDVDNSYIRQIYAAIISRVLEIPQEIGEGSEDYTTSTTLIPLLDFINHSSVNPWCVFDVDRKTNDVILKYQDLSKFDKNSCQNELFIQYSDIIEFTSFNFTYGFIPDVPKDKTLYFNISIDRDFLEPRQRLFYKWFNVNPVIQCCKMGSDNLWYINDSIENWEEVLLPFIVNSSINTQEIWKFNNDAHDVFAYFHNKIGNDPDISAISEEYRLLIKQEEKSQNDLIRLPQLAWSMTFKDTSDHNIVRKRVDKIEALNQLHSLSQTDYKATVSSFSDYLKQYFTKREEKLSKIIDEWDEQKVYENQSFIDLCQWELQALGQLKTRKDISYKTMTKVVQSSVELDPVPLPPPIMLHDSEEPIETEETETLVEELDALNIKQYDQSQFTDYLAEEQEQWTAYFS